MKLHKKSSEENDFPSDLKYAGKNNPGMLSMGGGRSEWKFAKHLI